VVYTDVIIYYLYKKGLKETTNKSERKRNQKRTRKNKSGSLSPLVIA